MTVLYDYCDMDGKRILVSGQGLGINVRVIPVFDPDVHVTPVSASIPPAEIPNLILALSGALGRITAAQSVTTYARVMALDGKGYLYFREEPGHKLEMAEEGKDYWLPYRGAITMAEREARENHPNPNRFMRIAESDLPVYLRPGFAPLRGKERCEEATCPGKEHCGDEKCSGETKA